MRGGLRPPPLLMARRLLSYDPLTGKREWFEHDPATRLNHITVEYDKRVIDQILEHNHFLETDTGKGWSKTREFRRVASIPLAVLDIWRGEGINWHDPNHWPAIRAKLDSNEFRMFRTAPGHLGKASKSTAASSRLKRILQPAATTKP